jgi:hypothetical protein
LTSLKKQAVNEAYQIDSNLGASTAEHEIEDPPTTEGEVTNKKTTVKIKSPKKKIK